MLKNRLIAVILLRDGNVVQSVKFKHTNYIHYNPVHAIESFYLWAVDEIIILNVSRNELSKKEFFNIISQISDKCFVPLTVGGWINNMDTVKHAFNNGADKIIINTQAFLTPSFITEIATKYGSQCVVLSIDSKQDNNQNEYVCINRGTKITNQSTVKWASEVEKFGAGELFINSIDYDGNRAGYNLKLLKQVTEKTFIPVIAMGGVFTWEHLVEGIKIGGVDAVAAANIFHYTEQSIRNAKKYLINQNLNFRKI